MNVHAPARGSRLGADGRRIGVGPRWLGLLLSGPIHRLLDLVDARLERGALEAVLPDGTARLLGGRAPGFSAEIDLYEWRAFLRLITAGSVGWYQAWEAGEWTSPDPVQLFALAMDNADTLGRATRAHGPWRLAMRWLQKRRANTRTGAQRNAAMHHDLGNDFFAAWLDTTMNYSGARFDGPGLIMAERLPLDLEAAQRRKMDTIADRIAGARTVLEIGCGFGGLAAEMSNRGMDVTAIDISREALRWAQTRQPGRIRFRQCDYRDMRGSFDAIVCVGVLMTVGRAWWPAFVDCLDRNLKPGGRVALQFVSIREELFDAYAASADFVQTCVHPGSMLLGEAEFRGLVEARGFEWRDAYRFGADYAETLRLWRERFELAIDEARLPLGFDERFVRLWRYYLMYAEGGFRGRGVDVVQVTLVKPAV